jgi:PPP family 3-phenylpropionic acid transporter
MGAGASAAERRSVAARLSFLYVAIFLFVGVGLPFWPVWLADKGSTAAEIGILLSLSGWTKIIGNPLIAQLADRSGDLRAVLIASAAASLATFALFAVVGGFWPFLIVTTISSLAISALTPLSDSLTMRMVATHRIDYGRVRLWGSLSFILAGLAAGWLIAGRSPSIVLPLLLGCLALTLLSAVTLPIARGPVGTVSLAAWLQLLRDRRLLLFILAAGFIQSSHAMLYGFGSLRWLAAGYGEDAIGLLWAIGVVAEVILFAFGGVLVRRLGPIGLLLLGGGAGMLRWVLFALFTSLPVLVLIQLLHALTFAATHLAAVYFLVREAPAGLAATAQGLYGAIAWGGLFGLAMLASGTLYAAFAGAAFHAMAAMCLVGAFCALMLLERDRP